MVPVQHDGPPVQRGSVHHPGGDLATDAGQLLQPVHRLPGLHRGKVRQVDVPAPFDQRGEAGLEPFGSGVGVSLGGKFVLQSLKRCLRHRFPTAPALEQPIGRRVGDGRFRARADHALHQHPFRLPPGRRRALDPPELRNQPPLQLAQRIGARIGAEGELPGQLAAR